MEVNMSDQQYKNEGHEEEARQQRGREAHLLFHTSGASAGMHL